LFDEQEAARRSEPTSNGRNEPIPARAAFDPGFRRSVEAWDRHPQRELGDARTSR